MHALLTEMRLEVLNSHKLLSSLQKNTDLALQHSYGGPCPPRSFQTNRKILCTQEYRETHRWQGQFGSLFLITTTSRPGGDQARLPLVNVAVRLMLNIGQWFPFKSIEFQYQEFSQQAKLFKPFSLFRTVRVVSYASSIMFQAIGEGNTKLVQHLLGSRQASVYDRTSSEVTYLLVSIIAVLGTIADNWN